MMLLPTSATPSKTLRASNQKLFTRSSKSGGLFIGLSGTPMPNGWIDFAGYSKLFGFVKGITEFKQPSTAIMLITRASLPGKYKIEIMETHLRRLFLNYHATRPTSYQAGR
jgi:hypothetical protein